MPVIGSLPMAATSWGASRASSSEIRKGSPPRERTAPSRGGLKAVVAAQDLHRQPSRHDLGGGGREKGLSAFWATSSLPYAFTQSTRRQNNILEQILQRGNF